MDSNTSGKEEMQSQAPPAAPTQCRNGCGYFAHSSFDGMCSKCYKDLKPGNVTPKSSSHSSTSSSSSSASLVSLPAMSTTVLSSNSSEASIDFEAACRLTDTTPVAATSATGTDKDKVAAKDNDAKCGVSDGAEGAGELAKAGEKAKKKRCHVCNKRVGLTGFDCRCGGHYCSTHRYSDQHHCSFDYRELGQTQIRKQNPVVAAEKVKKI